MIHDFQSRQKKIGLLFVEVYIIIKDGMSGDDTKSGKELLNTWKEIAAYLDCDAKTCQRWEKQRALPIRRIGGVKSGRAYAYRRELDAWLKHWEGKTSPDSLEAPPKKSFSRPAFRLLIFAVPILTAAFFLMSPPRQPADFRIEGDALVILNARGRELWRRRTGIPKLQDEAFYRQNFQNRIVDRDTERVHLPFIVIDDIDGNGQNEVLFSLHTKGEMGGGRLDCFNARGRLKWTLETGLEHAYGDIRYSADYIIYGILMENFDGGREKEIVILSGHYKYFPTRLMVLKHNGDILGDYWHSGRINDILIRDLDGDGHPEILAAGINNEYRKGFFLVFDGRRVGGFSPQIKNYYRSDNHSEGTERLYLLLPRTAADLQTEQVESVKFIDILRNGRISLTTHISGLDFEFGADLKPAGVNTSHRFDRLQAEAVREGRITRPMTAKEVEALAGQILYWTGSSWGKPPPESGFPPI